VLFHSVVLDVSCLTHARRIPRIKDLGDAAAIGHISGPCLLRNRVLVSFSKADFRDIHALHGELALKMRNRGFAQLRIPVGLAGALIQALEHVWVFGGLLGLPRPVRRFVLFDVVDAPGVVHFLLVC